MTDITKLSAERLYSNVSNNIQAMVKIDGDERRPQHEVFDSIEVVEAYLSSMSTVHKLIPYQAANAPMSLVFHLDYVKPTVEEFTETETQEKLNSPWADLIAQSRALAKEKLAENPDYLGADALTLAPISSVVAMTTKQRTTGYTLELCQDLSASHGAVDAQHELGQALAQECAHEDTHYLLHQLRSKIEPEAIQRPKTPREVLLHIMRASNNIARVTKRGCGNWIVISPEYFEELSTLFMSDAADDLPAGTFEDLGIRDHGEALTLRATLNKIKIYVQTFSEENEILIGYTGRAGIACTDTAMIHVPYIPFMTSGMVVDPITFQPKMRLYERSGLWIRGENENDSGDIKDYVRKLKIL